MQDARNSSLKESGTAELSDGGQPSEIGKISSSDSTNSNAADQNGNVTQDSQPPTLLRTATTASVGPPHSIFTTNQKRFIVFMASWAGFFSPVSANIYFPALNQLAEDFKVSNTLINLTLTSYMIFQGLAPAFMGSLADTLGRRPAYVTCFVIYIAANIGLALCNSYAALFILRCLQSTGSSATVAMASAVVADVATPSERGKYMGFTFAGSLLGPAVGPVIGGVLAQFLGWRSIFWFLTIFAGVFLVVFLVFFPETARGTVGNGSIPPKGYNMSLMNYLAVRKARQTQSTETLEEEKKEAEDTVSNKGKFVFPNPFKSLVIIADKQNALLLFYNAFLFAAFYDITATIPSQFAVIYNFDALKIGLTYIPFGFGSFCASIAGGIIQDKNFRRWCNNLNIKIKRGRDQNLADFPIEKVRLQIALPASYFASIMVLIFGWVLDINGPLAAMLVILFLTAFSMSIAFNTTSTLLVDFYPKRPATATAANNLVRCLLGAGATAVIVPMINGMGRGWTFTLLSLFLLVTSPMLWANYFRGMQWREERRVKDLRRAEAKDKKRGSALEEGALSKETDSVPVVGGMQEAAAVVEEEVERSHTDR